MATKFDIRQMISRDTLSHIFPNVSNKELDDIIRAVNDDLKQPLQMEASATPDLTITLGASTVTNAENNRTRSCSFAGKILPILSAGSTIVFPVADAGTITVTPGDNPELDCPSGQYNKILVYINALSEIGLLQGTPDSTESNVLVPSPPSNSLPVGYIVVHNTSGTIDNITQQDLVMFGSGAGGGSSADGGLGSDLGDLEFRASFEDSFVDSDLIDTASASHSPSNESYVFEYDTNGAGGNLSAVAGASTNITWTGIPNFIVTPGDVVIAKIGDNVEVRKITNVNLQYDVDIEAAFSANVNTATYVCVSQMIQTVDMVNWYDPTDPESFMISELIGHIALTGINNILDDAVDHSEGPTWFAPEEGDIILQGSDEKAIKSIVDDDTFVIDTVGFGVDGDARIIRPIGSFMVNYLDDGGVGSINIAAQAISTLDLASNWANEYAVTRNQAFQDNLSGQHILGDIGAHLTMRFFANKTDGKGSVELYGYQTFLVPETENPWNGGINNQAYGRLDGADTPINCDISLEGIRTRITFKDEFYSFVPGINPGLPYGDLVVILNGSEVPRYINPYTSRGTYYKEDAGGRYIELNTDYSAYNWLITIVRRQGTIDSSNSNSAKIMSRAIHVGTGANFDYQTLVEALAVVGDGDTIFVADDQSISAQLDLTKAFAYGIEFRPGVKIVCDTALAGSAILVGDDLYTKNFKLEFTHTSGTTPIGIESNGSRSYHENVSVIMNGVGGTITNAFKMNSGVKGNFVRGLARQIAGTMGTSMLDSSGNSTNDLSVRAVVG